MHNKRTPIYTLLALRSQYTFSILWTIARQQIGHGVSRYGGGFTDIRVNCLSDRRLYVETLNLRFDISCARNTHMKDSINLPYLKRRLPFESW